MATQYIKYTKKCLKNFFPNYGGHGFFWLGGGYAHGKLYIYISHCVSPEVCLHGSTGFKNTHVYLLK